MSTPKEPSINSFRLQALAKTVSAQLQQRFGAKQYYTADEVEAVCNQCNVPASTREYAVAMFVEPEQSQGFLQKLGSSKTAIELRKFMAQQIFFYYLPDASYDSSSANDFHHAGDSHSHGHSGFDGGSDVGGHGGHDSGGGDGGGGGGGGGD